MAFQPVQSYLINAGDLCVVVFGQWLVLIRFPEGKKWCERQEDSSEARPHGSPHCVNTAPSPFTCMNVLSWIENKSRK